MTKRSLIIVCGVPGAGKSTFAHHAVDRWGAVSFASEIFAGALGAAARTPAGVLTKQAMRQAYSAMGAAVTAPCNLTDQKTPALDARLAPSLVGPNGK